MIRTAAALLMLCALGACGLKGGLERPPPQFGDARRAYEAEVRAKAEAAEKAAKEKAEREKAAPPAPAPTSPVSPPPGTPQE
jgi:predicted small lipoprotein YifL